MKQNSHYQNIKLIIIFLVCSHTMQKDNFSKFEAVIVFRTLQRDNTSCRNNVNGERTSIDLYPQFVLMIEQLRNYTPMELKKKWKKWKTQYHQLSTWPITQRSKWSKTNRVEQATSPDTAPTQSTLRKMGRTSWTTPRAAARRSR